MSSTVPTPTIDALRARGAWSPALDTFAEWDPDWTERCARMANNPWTTGVLPAKWIELICIALNGRLYPSQRKRRAPSHPRRTRGGRDRRGNPRHAQGRQCAGHPGGSRKPAHPVRGSQPIRCAADIAHAGQRRHTARRQDEAAGLFNPAWDIIYALDPQWLEEFIAMGADLYRGVLPAKLFELVAIAVDASCTHLYTPGIRRHIQGALAHGATIDEIMEVLKLCGAQAIDACELGAPILSEELANRRSAAQPPDL